MKSRIAHILMIGLALASVACSATKDELTKQLDEVKRDITSLRAENAVLKDRVDVLEATPKTEHVADADEGEVSSDRPMLEVVHLSPEETPEEPPTVVAPPADNSPPMKIVGDDKGVNEVSDEPAKQPKAKTRAPKAWKRGR